MEVKEFAFPFNLEQDIESNRDVQENPRQRLKELKKEEDRRLFTLENINDLNSISICADLKKDTLGELCVVSEKLLAFALEETQKLEKQMEETDAMTSDRFINKKNLIKHTVKHILIFLKHQVEQLKEKQGLEMEQKKGDKKKQYNKLVEEKQKAILELLAKLVHKNRRLFDDSEMIKHIQIICLKTLQHNVVFKDPIFRIIKSAVGANKFNSDQLKAAIINFFEEAEHFSSSKVDFVVHLLSSFTRSKKNAKNEFVVTFFHKLIDVLMSAKSKDNTFNKNASDMLTGFFEVQPEFCYNNFSLLKILLGCESTYLVRNALYIGIINVMNYLLKKQKAGDELVNKQLETFFDLLLSRIYDKTSFSRVQVLKSLTELLSNNFLDGDQIYRVFSATVERIQDNSSHVRKRALVLLQELFIYFSEFFKDKGHYHDYLSNKEQFESRVNQSIIQATENADDDMIKEEESNPIVSMQKSKARRAELAVRIYTSVESIKAKIQQLLYSRNQSDVMESLRLLCIANKYGIPEFDGILRNSFNLIFVKEPVVKFELLRVFYKLYVEGLEPQLVIENLIDVFLSCDSTQKICFEEILKKLFNENTSVEIEEAKKPGAINNSKKKADEKATGNGDGASERYRSDGVTKINIHKSLLKYLWNYFKDNYSTERYTKAHVCLQILKFGVSIIPRWVFDNIKEILDLLKEFINNRFINWFVIKELTAIFSYNSENLSKEQKDIILKILSYFILKNHGTKDEFYLASIEKLTFLIFEYRVDPEVICEYIIKKMAAFLNNNEDVLEHDDMINNKNQSSKQVFSETLQSEYDIPMTQFLTSQPAKSKGKLSREEIKEVVVFKNKLIQLIYFVGQIALKFLYYIEKVDKKLNERKNQILTYGNYNELDQVVGGAEAEYEQQKTTLIHIINDSVIKKNLMPLFIPLLTKILSLGTDSEINTDSRVLFVAVDALSKFMLLSEDLALKNLDFFYNLLNKTELNENLKTNVIIIFGDLYHRYPNLLNKNIKYIFRCIKSNSNTVRRTTVTVLSHLILNDYIKIKAEIADFVFLLEDEDKEIAQNAKLFFTELVSKDTKFIHNILPDAISRLSESEESGGVSETQFEMFARHFLSFIEKDRDQDTLLEKLIKRLKTTDREKEARNILYCVSNLTNNDKTLNKLIEHVDTLHQKSEGNDAKIILKNLIFRLRRLNKINKSRLDEFEETLFAEKEKLVERLRNRKPTATTNKKNAKQIQVFNMIEEE